MQRFLSLRTLNASPSEISFHTHYQAKAVPIVGTQKCLPAVIISHSRFHFTCYSRNQAISEPFPLPKGQGLPGCILTTLSNYEFPQLQSFTPRAGPGSSLPPTGLPSGSVCLEPGRDPVLPAARAPLGSRISPPSPNNGKHCRQHGRARGAAATHRLQAGTAAAAPARQRSPLPFQGETTYATNKAHKHRRVSCNHLGVPTTSSSCLYRQNGGHGERWSGAGRHGGQSKRADAGPGQ